MDTINLMLADDHLIFRKALKYLLEAEGNIKVIAEASNGVECLEVLSKVHPDLLILDLNMPEKNGMEGLKEMGLEPPDGIRKTDVKVLILTASEDDNHLLQALKFGTDGYVLKTSSYDILKEAINSLANDKKYVQQDLLPLLYVERSVIEQDLIRIKSLTKREMDVLKNLAIGMYNKEIATKLQISERTVKNHISNIFKKIGVSDRTQAAVFAIRNNLIDIFKY